MAEPREGVQALVRPGSVFWTFSCEHDTPYKYAKIIKSDHHGLWVKMSVEDFAIQPDLNDFANLPGATFTVPITIDVFLAWGPPKFPIYLANEPVTEEEIRQCK